MDARHELVESLISLGRNTAPFGQQTTGLIGTAQALGDQARAQAMPTTLILLLDRFDRDRTHPCIIVRSIYGIGIVAIGLVADPMLGDKLGGHQLGLIAPLAPPARPVMRARARVH